MVSGGQPHRIFRYSIWVYTIKPAGTDIRAAYPPLNELSFWPRSGTLQWLSEDRLAFGCGENPENTEEFKEWDMICAAGADGSNFTVLHQARPEQDTTILGPMVLSPDRERVAFVRRDKEFQSHLMISGLGETGEENMGPVAREGRRITKIANLEWSPDGDKILVSLVESGPVGERHLLVRVFDLASNLTSHVVDRGRFASWSPDGSMIAISEGKMSPWLDIGIWLPERSQMDFLSVADADLSNVRSLLKAHRTDKE